MKLKYGLGFLFLLFSFFYSSAQTSPFKLEILAGENWWCGIVAKGSVMPLSKDADFYFDMKLNDCSQVQPLLLSNKGRVIWNNNPFTVKFKENVLMLEGEGEFILSVAGTSLREAQQFARTKYFPASGKLPDTLLFSKPQYNTWIELNYNQNQEDILKYAHNIIDHGFPPGVIMIDASWQQDYGLWDFMPGKFPNPKSMVDELHDLGFKVMLWIVPFISPDCTEFYPLLDKEKILIMDSADSKKPLFIKWWEGYSAEIDFTNPNGREWFIKQLTHLQTKFGIDGFKFDAGDFDRFPSNGVTFRKVSGNEHNSIYAAIGLMYPFNEYRASWKMGGQALGQRLCDKEHTWTDLQKVIPEMLLLGLSGYPYACPDMIGGGEINSFIGNSKLLDQDLVVRYAQSQALMPMMQFSVAPWRILDSVHLSAIVKVLNIRAKFSGYITHLAKQSAITGEPIMKSLEYVFPNQGFPKTINQYMLGDSIMVAPMLQSKTNIVKVTFPKIKKGKWHSDDGKIYKPGTTSEIEVPLNRLPYFIIKK